VRSSATAADDDHRPCVAPFNIGTSPHLDPAREGCRGILAAQRIKPQAAVLAEARGIRCVEVDLGVLRGEREPELTLFAL